MSWTLSAMYGKPAVLKPLVTQYMDRNAKMYEGKTEEKDVLAAKAAILAFLDETTSPAVKVEASGSRGGGWATIKVDCQAIAFHDEPTS